MLQFFDKNNVNITEEVYIDKCSNPSCLGEPWCSAWGHCQDEATTSNHTPLLEEPLFENGCGNEQEIDDIFTALSQQLASTEEAVQYSSENQDPNMPKVNIFPLSKNRFANPTTKEDLAAARISSVPKKTQDDMAYCMRIWNQWKSYRLELGVSTENTPITTLSKSSLDEEMSHFVLEVRKRDGNEYPPNTLYHIICGIMRHLRNNGQPNLDFFKDSMFANFRMILDAEMKRLQGKGLGSKRKQAEPLSDEDEEKLWTSGQLGGHCPQALVDTMLFMCGTYFALRSGQEHRALRFCPSQIELIEEEGQRSFLRYTEDVSKNHQGGLKGRKQRPKIVTHHANEDTPGRCFVTLYKQYQSKCPAERPSHVQPLKKTSKDCWYSTTPIGHSTLAGTVSRMCKAAGTAGYKTNHSLRATAATRLYQAGVDEQLIMEKTGHRSLEGVRSYKRTNTEQQENISDILSLTSKRKCRSTTESSYIPGFTSASHSSSALVMPSESTIMSTSTSGCSNISTSLGPPSVSPANVSTTSTIMNHNKQFTMIQPENLQNLFSMNSCSNMNIHINFLAADKAK